MENVVNWYRMWGVDSLWRYVYQVWDKRQVYRHGMGTAAVLHHYKLQLEVEGV
jgi:hypothetical protein